MPIRLIHDRWITKFAELVAASLAGLKTHLEGTMHVFEVHVKATPAQVWAAMTEPDLVRQWNHGLTIESSFRAGEPLRYLLDDATVATEAVIESIDPGRGGGTRAMLDSFKSLLETGQALSFAS